MAIKLEFWLLVVGKEHNPIKFVLLFVDQGTGRSHGTENMLKYRRPTIRHV
jgi:hypothetical protein